MNSEQITAFLQEHWYIASVLIGAVIFVGGGLVDGDGAGIGGGVGLLLTNMELQSLKLIIRHSIFPLYLYSKYYFYS